MAQRYENYLILPQIIPHRPFHKAYHTKDKYRQKDTGEYPNADAHIAKAHAHAEQRG